MTKLLASLLFLSFKNDIVIKDVDIGCLNALDKNECLKGPFFDEKQMYRKSRGPKYKQSLKLKDSFKELEELIENYHYIFLRWGIKEPLLLLFNNGTVVSITLNEENSCVEKVVIDNYLCGKLVSEHLIDAVLDERGLIISYIEPKMTYIYFNQEFPSFLSKIFNTKKGKILGNEPKISNVDLVSPYGKRLERKLSFNNKKDCILTWWCKTFDDVGPWTPVNYSLDRINMLVYTISGPEIEALCSVKVNGELLHATFSSNCTNQILSLEEIKKKHTYSVYVCIYELARGRCQCISLTEIPTHGSISSFAWNSSEDKVLLAGVDKSLLIYDVTSNSTLITSTVFCAKYVSWHPESGIVFVLGSGGELQCFDAAFTHIMLEVLSETSIPVEIVDFKTYFSQPCDVQQILWQTPPKTTKFLPSSIDFSTDSFLVSFKKGPLVFVKLSVGCIRKGALTEIKLISQYLKHGDIDEAIYLLQRLNWVQQAELSFNSLSIIVNYLLRRTLNSKTEAALELALGTFYNSCGSLPPSLLSDYKLPVNHLARRFFHHLLRYHRFDKAFLLAIDLECRDLFLDLHHVAKQRSENMLAIVSLQRAEELLSSESSSCSDGSEESEDVSISSRSVSASETGDKILLNEHSLCFNDKDFCKQYTSYRPHYEQKLLPSTHTACDSHDLTSQVSTSEFKPESMSTPTSKTDTRSNVNFSISAHGVNGSSSRLLPFINQSYRTDILKNQNYQILEKQKPMNSFICPPKVTNEPLSSHHNIINANCSRNFRERHKQNSGDENLTVHNEYFEEEDEDVEGTRIKLVHFGVV